MEAAFQVSYLLLWVLVIFQGLILLGLVNRSVRTYPATDDKPENLIGRAAPGFTAPTTDGSLAKFASGPGSKRSLLFLSTDCSACVLVLTTPQIDLVRSKGGGNLTVVCRSPKAECEKLARTYLSGSSVVVDRDLRISQLYGVERVPTAVLVNENGVVTSYGHPEEAVGSTDSGTSTDESVPSAVGQ